MKIKCDYCSTLYDDSYSNCPNCGAINNSTNRTSNNAPRTVQELKDWYVAHNLPSENITRFFIGKNVRESKAYGIYQDFDGDFVVYKNKSDGSRAIRYKGSDEAYAVNEIYQKLKEDIILQKSNQNNRPTYNRQSSNKGRNLTVRKIVLIIVIIQILMPLLFSRFLSHNSNYYANNSSYSRDYSSSYSSDYSHNDSNSSGWDSSSSSDYSSSSYDDYSSSSWDNDWDSSWDSDDSWDSSWDDWDSDW